MRISNKTLSLSIVIAAGHALAVCAGDIPAVTAFGCDLYQQVRQQPGNLCVSPVSVFAALSMAYAGSTGKTAEQFAQVLHSPAVPNGFPLSGRLGAVRLDLVCALFLQQGTPVNPDFANRLKKGYGVSPFPVDFVDAAPSVRTRINNWVGQQTNGKIQNILSAPLDTRTRLLLVNAVYFKGIWKSQFKLSDTQNASFSLTETEHVTIPLMSQTGRFAYFATDGLQLLSLPYQGNTFSMLFILPDGKSPGDLARAEKMLSAETVSDWPARMAVTEVTVSIPRFKFAWGSIDLKPALQALGLGLPFTPDADFSGISTNALRISDVVHKTFIDVNESGTEAAASTSVSGLLESIPPNFCADHPFLFLIQENRTCSILFMGRVTNPKET